MNSKQVSKALNASMRVARSVGGLLRKNLATTAKEIDSETQHDIKLALDVRSQKIIERSLAVEFPEIALLGEEGVRGDAEAPLRWVVDPIDGTVNFAYGIPHACVSIALQERGRAGGYRTLTGMVYDPFLDEMWTATQDGPARLNGRRIQVSGRSRLDEAIVAMGFAKQAVTMNKMLSTFRKLVPRVRKIRLLGAAALSMTWVAAGRLDAYKEYGVRLWDIAAGGLIVERAGGEFWHKPVAGENAYQILVSNGRMRSKIEKLVGVTR